MDCDTDHAEKAPRVEPAAPTPHDRPASLGECGRAGPSPIPVHPNPAESDHERASPGSARSAKQLPFGQCNGPVPVLVMRAGSACSSSSSDILVKSLPSAVGPDG